MYTPNPKRIFRSSETIAMKNHPKLIVMLTHEDLTVPNAAEIFEQCRNSQANFWGFKEHPLPKKNMKELYARMKECGKTTFLEVVAYTEAEGLEGAKIAADCGCDILMGTIFSDSINDFCQQHQLKYMPFVGTVEGRPSVLSGDISDIVAEAKNLLRKGVFGIDLLGYRYTGNAVELNQALRNSIEAPICIAGSIDSFEKLDEIKQVDPWAYTIGSAFFEKKFGQSFCQQIDNVCHYMECGEKREEVKDA